MLPGRAFFIMLFVIFIPLTTVFAGDLNKDLINAAKKGDINAVKSYLAKGADVCVQKMLLASPLYLSQLNTAIWRLPKL